jgi:SAM-dependent methyltransferase
LDAGLACGNGHRHTCEAGVASLLRPDFAARLDAFLTPFTALREAEGKRRRETAAYPELPFGPAAEGDAGWRLEWRLRRYDLALVRRLAPGWRRLRVLDVGAWNGWLSHRLAELGHQVTAVDYFVDEHDGLRARRHYPSAWQAVQVDLDDLSILGETYDLVIVNRCLAFFGDPAAYAEHAKARVAPGGRLLITGLLFFRDVRAKQAGVRALREQYQSRGFDFLKPFKGFVDQGDEARLRALGFTLRLYPELWRANLLARVWGRRPRHMYGVWSE